MHNIPVWCDTHNIARMLELSTFSLQAGEISARALDQPNNDFALDLAWPPVLGWPPVQAQPPFLAFGFNHNFHRCAATIRCAAKIILLSVG